MYPDLETLESSLQGIILRGKSSASCNNISIFGTVLYTVLRAGKEILDQLRTKDWNVVKHTTYYKRFATFVSQIEQGFLDTKKPDRHSDLLSPLPPRLKR